MVKQFLLNVGVEHCYIGHLARLQDIDAEHASHYKMKNACANLSKGEVFVFLNSNLMPAIVTFTHWYVSFSADNFIY
jgi:hypothetical protein